MTDMELEVKFDSSYIDCKIGHISLRHGMVDVVSTAELHDIYMETTPGAISTLHENDDIEAIS